MLRRPMFRIGMIVLGLLAAVLVLTARHHAVPLSLPAIMRGGDAVARGGAAFAGADFGGLSLSALETHAVPWRLTAAAIALDAQAENPSAPLSMVTVNRRLARYGFLVDARIANLPPGVAQPARLAPPGFTVGDIAPVGGTRVRIANLGCVACHGGVGYRADGSPDTSALWLAMPNSSINLESYTQDLYRIMQRQAADPDRLIAATQALFPDMGWAERQSLRWIVLPRVRARLSAIAASGRGPLPFPNGRPGSTNGVAALKFALHAPLAGGGPGDAGFVSVPNLGDRLWRTSLLVDGAYAPPGGARQVATTAPARGELRRQLAAIMTFFTVPSMGVHPDTAIGGIDTADDVMAFIGSARSQPFPGTIDRAAATRGAGVYANACAACHGSYVTDGASPRLVRFPNWQGDVGTDQTRARLFDAPLVRAINGGPYRSRIGVAAGRGYVAPPLAGIWASAPYLHNGSVPTLAALLNPASRPAQFMVGGHALDFTAVGIRLGDGGRYPPGYRPFADPVLHDTRAIGAGNGGHDYGATLSPGQQSDLIAFLKTL